MAETRDDLDTYIDDQEREIPGFAARVEAEAQRLALIGQLREIRLEQGLSQTRVAAAMYASQSQLAEIEAGSMDIRWSTIIRYAHALGVRLDWTLHRVA